MPTLKKAVLTNVRYRAYCETEGKPVGKWTDKPTAKKDAIAHLEARPSHDVQIVVQQTSAAKITL